MWFEKLVRKEILDLEAYSSARGECQILDQINLDANESPQLPYGDRMELLNRYPEPQPIALRQRLSEIYSVATNCILITRGMDEGIDLVVRTFCRPYVDSIAIAPPTYSFYKVAADVNAIKTLEVPQDENFTIEWQNFMDLVDVKVFFLCRPNNPTGAMISLNETRSLCIAKNNLSLVVVDEAYIEFSDELSATTLLDECPNLIVMRTLSKAYGLAGLRLGAVLASEGIINVLKKIISPYPITRPSALKALEALSPIGLFYAKQNIENIKQQREILAKNLLRSPKIERVFPSYGNFLLAQTSSAEQLLHELKQSGIIVRNRSSYVSNSLRFSIGSQSDNYLLLAALGVPGFAELKRERTFSASRKTFETEIFCKLNLDVDQKSIISTGIKFFDHMLEQLAAHGGISLTLKALGDTEVDDHHTVEDVAIVLGTSLKSALGQKLGIERFGFLLSMDESQTQISLDLSSRGICVFNCAFPTERIGTFPVEMIEHFFQTLSLSLGAGIHIKTYGNNSHHMAEGIFKAFGRSLRQATALAKDKKEAGNLPSTKGVL